MYIIRCLFQERYSSFKKGLGAKIEKGTATLEECEVRQDNDIIAIQVYSRGSNSLYIWQI